jgi:chemotaxis protein methyltransferase CheR
MDNSQINDLIALVANRIGLTVSDKERESFRDRIHGRMKSRGEADPRTYMRFLCASTPEAADEWQKLVHLLTTGESYFFRDQGQHELLMKRILPRLLDLRKEKKTLRIWSAGCATGEEPYSLAMLIDELLPVRSGWQIFILGTDLNARALEKARTGVYSQWSFRMVDPAVKARYFSRRQGEWELDRKIRDMVTFRQGNLVEERLSAWTSELHSLDLILCRNVFIYFDPETVAQVVARFVGVMNEGGYLLTGHGEVPQSALKEFTTVVLDDHVLYQKSMDSAPKPVKPPLIGTTYVPAAGGKNDPAPPVPSVPKQPGASIGVSVSKRREPHMCEAEFATAQAAANAGRYEEALLGCRAVLAQMPTFAPAYLLLAQLAEAQGNLDEAEESLKKLIFLKYDHIAAYLELAGIYARKHDARRSEQMYSAATELLRALPAGAAVETCQGMTAGELLRHVEELRGAAAVR